MRNGSPPRPAVKRLSLYLRQLEQLAAGDTESVSSRQLAQSLRVTDAQVRKDLACFGQFGRRGVGYSVSGLIESLRHILGTDKIWNVVLVGAGDLGRALLRYRGFANKGFRFVAAFDVSSAKVGKMAGDVQIRHIDDLEEVVREYGVKLAVVAVPAEAAQKVTDLVYAAGITGILNFAPTILHAPPHVTVLGVDLAARLEQLSFRAAAGK